ncbi:MAG: saccharopine dehydrogenase NADP-binding domain-containing protein [Candidatus Melainabacteria bacterium]|jgi:short subunit dehydrogenase-like uncharacterized protein|nr:saccharopine dehydrogenase NADP-binding domain-containing protein [Candidatus Melainabacteria bacterium]
MVFLNLGTESVLIAVIGATGFTGKLVASYLASKGSRLLLCGRNQQKLDALRENLLEQADPGGGTSFVSPVDLLVRKMDVAGDSIQDIANSLAGVSVAINCAGPFTRLGEKIVTACLEAGVHYLDISGEAGWIARLVRDFEERGRERGVMLIPACAFEYAIADSAAQLLHEELRDLDRFESTYVIDGFYTSAGTRASILEALKGPAMKLAEGRLCPIDPGALRLLDLSDGRRLTMYPFAGGEVYLVPLHTTVRNIETFLTSDKSPQLMALLGRVLPTLVGAISFKGLGFLRNMVEAIVCDPDKCPTQEERKTTRFTLICRGFSDAGESSGVRKRTLTVGGVDPYFLTAVIAGECALVIQSSSEKPEGGVTSPAMLGGQLFIQSITRDNGCVWHLGG